MNLLIGILIGFGIFFLVGVGICVAVGAVHQRWQRRTKAEFKFYPR